MDQTGPIEKDTLIEMDVENFDDLLEEIQQVFDIRFDYNSIYNRITVGEIIDMVIKKSGYTEGKECSHQVIFFRLRKDLTSHLAIPSKSITLDTPLEELFPEKERRKSWAPLFRFTPIRRIPSLAPGNIIWLPVTTLLLSPLLAVFLSSLLLLLILPLLSIIMIYILLRTGKELPGKTVEDLVHLIIKDNYRAIRQEFGTFNRNEEEKIICSLVDSWVLDDSAPTTAATRIEYEEKK